MTAQTTPEQTSAAELSEDAIAEFLRTHHDFFVRHIELLDVLRLPHPTHGAVSLIERQLSVLRERNRNLERKLDECSIRSGLQGFIAPCCRVSWSASWASLSRWRATTST
ncbi:MAG: DUF484 family protein [Acidihalobacter sp.]